MGTLIQNIFLNHSENKNFTDIQCIERSDTEHYKGELSDFLLDEVYVICRYKDIKELLEAFKYRSDRESGKSIASVITRSIVFKKFSDENIGVFVPVPMHWSRYLIRGFDHIWYLLRILSYRKALIIRKILVAPFRFRQSLQTKSQRIEKKFGNFKIKSNIPLPKTVILFDDVISTGTTANACAKALKDAGVEKVIGLFLASNRD